MFSLSITSNAKQFQRDLEAQVRKQVAFAGMVALNTIARDVQAAVRTEMDRAFDRPMPQTKKAVRIIPATKSRLVATVFVQDFASRYLEPYLPGGSHMPVLAPGQDGVLDPVAASLNRYGALGVGRVKSLAARSDVFVGEVQTANGPVRGVWQRPTKRARKGQRGPKGGRIKANRTDRLKLLVAFQEPKTLKQTFDFHGTAQRTVERMMQRRMADAWAKALASARR